MDLTLVKSQIFAIFYYSINEDWSDRSANSLFKNLSDFPGQIPLVTDMLATDFSSVDFKTLCTHPPTTTETFISYVKSKFPKKVLRFISLCFPPTFLKFSKASQEILYLFIRLVVSSNDPNLAIKWICRGLFQNAMGRSKNMIKINAITKIKDEEMWVAVDDNFISVYNSTMDRVMGCFQPESINVDRQQKVVYLIGENDKLLFTFNPKDDSQLELWEKIANNEDVMPNIASFLTAEVMFYPEPYLALAYSAFTENNMYAVRALLNLSIDYKTKRKVIEQLLVIFSYSQKVPLLLMTIVISELERNDVSKDTLEDDNSAIAVCFDILVGKGNEKYEKFITRIADYASKEYSQKTLFTVLKYLFYSSQLLNPYIRFFLSIIRTYIPLVINEKDVVYSAMKTLIIDHLIIPKLKECRLAEASRIVTDIEKAFNFSLDQYSWNRRLEKHYIQKLYSFIFSCGDPCDPPCFDTPKVSNTMSSLTIVLKIITKNIDEYQKEVRNITSPLNFYGDSLSYNFAAIVASMFSQCFDSKVISNEGSATVMKLEPIESGCFNDIMKKENDFNINSCDRLQRPDFDNIPAIPVSSKDYSTEVTSDIDDDIDNFRKDRLPPSEPISIHSTESNMHSVEVQHKMNINVQERDPLNSLLNSTDFILPDEISIEESSLKPICEMPTFIINDIENNTNEGENEKRKHHKRKTKSKGKKKVKKVTKKGKKRTKKDTEAI